MHVFLIIVLLFAGCPAFSQPDSLFTLDNKTGVRSLEHWFLNVRHDTIDPSLERLQKSYREQGKPLLERFTWLAGRIVWIEKSKDTKEVEERYLLTAKEVHKKGWKDSEGELWVHFGNFYSGIEQYGKAFEYCLRGYYRFEELGFQQNPHLYRYLGIIADIYYRLGDWGNSLKYLTILNNVPESYSLSGPRFHIQNTLGLVYRNLNRYDSSAYFFRASYETAKAYRDSFWMGLSLGNLGYNYFLAGNLDSARILLEFDYEESRKKAQWESATNAGLTLANIYINQNEFGKATEVLNNVESTVMKLRTPRMMRSWFENLYRISAKQGIQKDAVIYADSALKYKELNATNMNAQLMANTRSKVEAEQYLNKIALLESKRQQSVILRNALLAGIGLTAIILLLIINRGQAKHRYAMEKAAMEKKQADEKLGLLNAQLAQFTLSIKEKTRLIEQFENELNATKAHLEQDVKDQNLALEKLLHASILTEDEWQGFKDLFEKVHPGFLLKIRQTYPDLTPAETRMLVMAKLKLTNKEMMAMLGIGYDAIKKARQRLRKKINLSEEGNLEEWVALNYRGL